jgi:hypothetical protein
MALVLPAINEMNPGLQGSITTFSYCLSGLDTVQNLPPYQIPSHCQHSNILKVIMVKCSNLSFSWYYKHIKARQDDGTDYHLLSRELQLNCATDCNAKMAIWSFNATNLPHQQQFLLELICAFVR